jgi:hypothetical protein
MKKLILFALLASPLWGVWPNGYTYKATYVVNASQITGTLTNLTVVVAGTVADYKTTGNSGQITHTCAQTLYSLTIPADLIFTDDSAGTNVLKWQFETYTASSGAYAAHVKFPSAAVGSTLYAWYGNNAITTCQGGLASAAWDTNTAAALALPNGTTLSTTDYLGHTVTTDAGGVTAAAGLNSGAASFAGGTNSDLQIAGVGRRTKPLTACGWLYWSSGGGSDSYAISDHDSGSDHPTVAVGRISSTGKATVSTNYSTNYPQVNGTTTLTTNTWFYVCSVISSSTITLYVNGASEGTPQSVSGALSTSASTYVALGRLGASATANLAWTGRITEVTIDSIDRTTAWIAARYNNTNSPSSFWTVTTGLTFTGYTSTPSTVPNGHSGNITLTLSGGGTSWTAGTPGTPTFTLSGVANVTKISQSIASSNSATIVITTGAGTGTLTIDDGTSTTTVSVATPSVSVSPSTGIQGVTQTVTLTGTATVWTQETAAGLFSLSGGSGASIGTPTCSTDTSCTASLVNGSAGGTLTITDTSTTKTTTFGVSPLITFPDASVVLSPNAYSTSGGAVTFPIGGSYIRFKFTGSTSLIMNVKNGVNLGSSANNMPSFKVRLDTATTQGTWAFSQMSTASGASDTQALTLATGLSTGTTYTAQIYAIGGKQDTGDGWASHDFWTQVNSLQLTPGGAGVSNTARTCNIMWFGDSIMRPYYGQSATPYYNEADSTKDFVYSVSEAMQCEYMAVGVSGQGWSKNPSLCCGSGYPAFTSSWKYLSSGVARSTSVTPDWIVVQQGNNDTVDVTTAVTSWIADARSVYGTSPKILLVGPHASSMTTRYAQIVAGAVASGDSRVWTLDLTGTSANIMGASTPSWISADGNHPYDYYNVAFYGGPIYGKMRAILAASPYRAVAQ